MSTPATRHFLDIAECEAYTLRTILDEARRRKDARAGLPRGAVDGDRPLRDRLVALIFERPSTRTRVSFEVALHQLGAGRLVLGSHDMQLGRGETVADTARVLSRYVDAIMLRATEHQKLLDLAAHASVPVINGLTDLTHPCQVMADVMTLEERVGPLAEQRIAWIGDGNNVAVSWIEIVTKLGGELVLACPEGYEPPPARMAWAARHQGRVSLVRDPAEAVAGASAVITDAWVSMHHTESAERASALAPYKVDTALIKKAPPRAIFMHCLPAHRGEEVSDAVMDGPQSAIFDEAENRLHVQKAILLYCLDCMGGGQHG